MVDHGVLAAFESEWSQNARPTLESVINDGLRTVLYDGDAVSSIVILSQPGLILI